MTNIEYIAYFVDAPATLLDQVPPALSGDTVKVYAHHMTVEYRPRDVRDVKIGEKTTLIAYAEAKSESVHAVLVKAIDDVIISKNTYPHITIATANGAAPKDSNELIADSIRNESVRYFSSPIEINVTLGYFDGSRPVTMR